MSQNPRRICRVLAIAAVAVLLGTPSEAYYHYVHFASRTGPFNSPIYEKFDLTALNKTVTFFVSDQSPTAFGPNDSLGSVLSQVKQALATWNAVSSSDLRLSFGGLESYTLNPTVNAPGNSVPGPATPGGDVIFVDLPPGIIGLGAPLTSPTPVIGPNGSFFPILRGLVMLSRDTTAGAGPSYFEAFFTTAVHEVGHALGLQHTWTGSAMSQGVIRNTSRARPLDADDIAGLSVLYGKPGWAAGYGSIAGRVTLNNQGVAMASVVAISPNGPAVSTLTNPDGTYRIDGLPPNLNYEVYVHPLPPDGIVPSGEGLKVPVDQNGQPMLPSTGVFQTVFSPATLDPQQATSYYIASGAPVQTVNFAVQPRGTLPTYDVVTYARLNTATRTYTSSGDTSVTPAFLNSTQSPNAVIAQANPPAFLPNPQSMIIMGGFAPAILNNKQSGQPTVLPYPAQAGTVVAYFYTPLGAGTGPRHLVFNFGNDIYVLPNGVTLVQKGPPLINAVSPNADGTVTVTGAGFGLDSSVYFDGLKANVTAPFSGTDALGSITVTPPPGASGQVSTITLYNTDGQNSMILESQNPPTFTYPLGPAPQVASITINSQPAASLPAASSAAVTITGANTTFQDGLVTVGFGSDDVTVRRLWVVDSTHLIANVVAVAGATLGPSEISVISGFQVIEQPGGFQTQTTRLGLPFIGLPVVNADSSQQTIYPGSIASIYGSNLALSSTSAKVTLYDGKNDVPMVLQTGGVSATQINFFVPAGFPTGAAILKLNNGSQDAFPVMVQIDGPPPSIAGVNNQSNQSLNGAPVGAGDILNVVVTGLDPGVLTNQSRVQVAVSGVMMPLLSISPLPNGQFQIQFIVTQSFSGASVPLVVWVDGSSSQPFNITVR
ncbi:MAG TPA: matrixin family metalloprotease [Bryobacteraceae bacterium]|nr:matrixin family metalloprotease [Bryobacteraceae bacterium]